MGLRDKAKQKEVVRSTIEIPIPQTSTPEPAPIPEIGLRVRAKALINEAIIPPIDSNINGIGKLQHDEPMNLLAHNEANVPMPEASSLGVVRDTESTTMELSSKPKYIVKGVEGAVSQKSEYTDKGESIDSATNQVVSEIIEGRLADDIVSKLKEVQDKQL